MTNYKILYARDRYIRNLSHFHGTGTSTASWMHAKRTPDGGRRKKISNSTLFLSGLSRSAMCLNAESDDLNILLTQDTSPFLVTLMLSQSFPVSMRTLPAGKKRLASQFNFTYRYIDDVLSNYNPDFENYLGQMYPPELEIKDTTESNTSASYLDLLLSIGRDGQLHTSLYDKRDDFNFHITNFPFLSSNIPSSPAYGVYISQPIRYARACSSYECFILRAMRLSNKLLGQGYVRERLKSSLRKFYGRYGDLTKQYEVPSPECYTTFWTMTTYSDTLHW